jgi:hypothetical protein
MAITNGKQKSQLLGSPRTSGYEPLRHDAFYRRRDLPWFRFEIIRDMLLDPTLRLGLAMRAAPLHQAEIAHQVAGPDGKPKWVPGIKSDNQEVAAFVMRQVKRVWKFGLHKLLKAQIWGWSAVEVTYRLTNDKLVEIDKLLHRHAEDTYAITQDGEVCGVQFRRIKGGNVNLLTPKAFWHTYNSEGENPHGSSILFGALSSWADKWLNGGALDVRRLFMHKDAYGGVDTTYPPGTTTIDGVAVPNRDIIEQVADQLKAGGTTTRPAQFDANGNEMWTLNRATVPSNPTHILEYPKDLDAEMLNGLEIPDDVIKSEMTGAWQGKQVPMQAFFTAGDVWLANLFMDFRTQILDDLVKLNFGSDIEYEIETKPLAEQAFEQMQDGGESEQPGEQPAAQPPAQPPRLGQQPAIEPPPEQPQPRFPARRFSLELESDDLPELKTGDVAALLRMSSEETRLLELTNPTMLRMQSVHAPAGGVNIQGKQYKGGEFIPGDVVAKATTAEKSAIEGKDGREAVKTTGKAATKDSKQTNTPEFKKWFGDSKVVDDDGQPLVVYHGTSEDFREFQSGKRVSTRGQDVKRDVFYFDPNPSGASLYADASASRGPGANVIPVYLSLQNPKLFYHQGDLIGADVASMKAEGHDGFIRYYSDDPGIAEIGVFSPTQIKSATGNKGTFDPENPDIRMAIVHAPAGGATVAGKHFKGGQFIPKEVLAEATESEKQALQGEKKKSNVTQQRHFSGKPKQVTTRLTKQQTGALGEKLAIDYLKSLGFEDAREMNLERNNFPVDLIQDHEVYEVKAGLISNSTGAQKWRLTIGEPGKKEKAWLKSASTEEKASWNARKAELIVERKRKVVEELSKKLGRPVKLKTLTMIIDPDEKKADIHLFDGSHPIIRWRSDAASNAYKGTLSYAS